MNEQPPEPRHGGVIHTYLGYDPQRFPMPAAASPDLVSPAFNHLMMYGSLRHLTEEELANAIELDPTQITGLGPSLSALIAMLEERKRKILETYETQSVQQAADQAYRQSVGQADPPVAMRRAFDKAVRDEQVVDFERIWYAAEETTKRQNVKTPEQSAPTQDFAGQVLKIMERLGEKYEVRQLSAKYRFSGKKAMTVPQALEIKEELETIDRLLEQLRKAAKDAKIYVINMEELARFASEEQVEGLEALQRQVEEMLRQMAEEQGLNQKDGRYVLSPKAMKLFQSKLLDKIFADLSAARSGRHVQELTGDGAVELPRTKPYEFGDSLANMDVPATLINAMIREAQHLNPQSAVRNPHSNRRIRVRPEDIEIHLTRNTPKCATVVCMDMSGSMRWNGQYIDVKRMALALHGLIRTEYPGDFVDFVEIYTLPKRRHISEVPALLPKPVTLHEPWVRLKADMSDDRLTESDIHPHFTNIQHGLRLARQVLQGQDTPNRQIILITDGLPTAHFEDHWLYLLYPPDPRTVQFTLREGRLCHQQGITINVFLLSSWAQDEEDVRFAYQLAEETKGRVFFVGGSDLDRFVVWDYVRRRRFVVG